MNRISVAAHSTLARRWASPNKLPVLLSPTITSWSSNSHDRIAMIIRRTYYGNEDDDHHWWQRSDQQQNLKQVEVSKPGSKAFVSDIEENAVVDLFFQYASDTKGHHQPTLDLEGVHQLLDGIGECHDDETVKQIFADADIDNSGGIDLQEFLIAADKILGSAPARIVLIVGGPGSG